METALECSSLLREDRETIISEWENEVRQEIVGASMSDSLALRDHLPELLDDIAEIFVEKQTEGFDHKTDKYGRTYEKNQVHGRLRAETESYTIDQVILEYFILHRIITEKLQEHELLSVNIVNLLKYILERTVMQASAAFSLSIQEMQDKLIGTLAHDIRNPLTTALTGIEMLSKNPSQHKRIVRLIRKSLQRSIDLTEELLDNISLKAGQGIMMNFSESDYVTLVQEACQESSDAYSHPVICEIPEKEVKGNLDAAGVRRLIDNLISNAIKYGDAELPVKILFQATDQKVILNVHNHGQPISSDLQESIFDFLRRGDIDIHQTSKGWGMGLTLVKLIANAHDGEVEVISNQQDGTTFKVTLKRFPEHYGKVRMKTARG